MANVISYKGQKYVRVDNVKVRRDNHQFEAGLKALESFNKDIPSAISNLKSIISTLESELKGVKSDLPYAKKLKSNETLLQEMFDKGDSRLFDVIAWGNDGTLMRLVKQCLVLKNI